MLSRGNRQILSAHRCDYGPELSSGHTLGWCASGASVTRRKSSWDSGSKCRTDRRSLDRRSAAGARRRVRRNTLDRTDSRDRRRSRDRNSIRREQRNRGMRHRRNIRGVARKSAERRSRDCKSQSRSSILSVRHFRVHFRGGSRSSVHRSGFRRRAGRNCGFRPKNSGHRFRAPVFRRNYCARLQSCRRDPGPSRLPASMRLATCRLRMRSMRIFGT